MAPSILEKIDFEANKIEILKSFYSNQVLGYQDNVQILNIYAIIITQ